MSNPTYDGNPPGFDGESVSDVAPNHLNRGNSVFGLLAPDLAVLGTVAVLCVGHFPIFLLPSTPLRVAGLLVLGLPGLVYLAILASSRDKSAVSGAALAAWVLIAAMLSGAPANALKGMYGRELTGLIVILGVGAWAIGRVCSCAAQARLPVVIAIALGFNAIVGLAQVIFDVQTGFLAAHGTRATGLTASPVYFGALMAAAAALLARSRTLPQHARFAGVFVFAVACNLSGSRVAALAGLFAIGLAAVRDRDGHGIGARFLPAYSFVAGLAVGAIVATDDTGTERLATAGGGGRLDAWGYGARAVIERPVGGWGFGRFRAATQEHFSADFVRQFASDDLRQAWFDGHNLLVTTAVAIGVVGLGLTLWFAWSAGQIARGPLAYFILVLSATWLLQPAGLATLPVGLVALGAAAPRSDAARVASAGGLSRLAVAAGLVAFSVGIWVVASDIALKRAIDDGSPKSIESAARLYPGDSVVADVVAQAWFAASAGDLQLRERAELWSRRSIEREPERPYLLAQHGQRLLAYGDWAGARDAAQRALRLEPWHLQSWIVMYGVGELSGDPASIEEAARMLCRLGVGLPECPTL